MPVRTRDMSARFDLQITSEEIDLDRRGRLDQNIALGGELRHGYIASEGHYLSG
jgi:hypothetical protein